MIPGIVAATLRHAVVGGGGGGPPVWLPPDALSYANFSTGQYYAGGSTVLASAIFGTDANMTTNWGSNSFSSGDVTPGTGYVGGTFAIVGAMLVDIVAGSTIVLEFNTPFGSYTSAWMVVGDNGGNGVELKGFGFDQFALLDYNSQSPIAGPGGTFNAGVNKVAMTINLSAGAFSTNGGSATAASGYGTRSFTWAGIMFTDSSDALVAITVYAPKLNADLPGLST